MLIIVTCFTAGHSVTLALAALNVINLPAKLLEPLIAAPTIVVAVDNPLRRKQPLVHGFGFAGILRERAVAHSDSITLPLLGFNLRVESGQVLVATLLVRPVHLSAPTGMVHEHRR